MTGGDLGTFRKVDPRVIDDDPFWSAVRRRHPDVGVVLLPPDDPPEEPPEVGVEVDPDLEKTWRLIEPLVPTGAAEPPSLRRDLRADGPVLVLEQAVAGLGQSGGTRLLQEVALALGRAGWRLRATTRDAHPLLEGRRDQLELRAEAGPAATTLAVTSWR